MNAFHWFDRTNSHHADRNLFVCAGKKKNLTPAFRIQRAVLPARPFRAIFSFKHPQFKHPSVRRLSFFF